MNKQEFEFLLKQGEGLKLEFKESEFGTRSLSRNPTIFSLFNKLELVEQIGSGIGRIKGEIKRAGLKEPVFQFGKFFVVTLFRPTQEELGKLVGETTTQKTTQKILELINQYPKISRRELAEKIGITEDGIKFNLNQLKKQKKIKRIGPDKGGSWEIVG